MVGSLNNLEKSEVVIARILEKLLEQGIRDVGLFGFTDLDMDQTNEPFFGGCIKWLIGEGIIKVEDVSELINGDIHVVNPVLTSNGFALLGRTVSIGRQIVAVADVVRAKSQGSTSYSGLGDFLGGLLGGFTKSIGS